MQRIAIFTTDDGGAVVSLEVGANIAAANSTANFRVTMRRLSRPG